MSSISQLTIMTTTQTFNALPFSGFVYFNPWATCYTARKKIKPEDLGLTAAELPPKTLASLGSMHSCDPQELQPFNSFRSAMHNACAKYGTRRMGGFLVEEGKAIEVAADLEKIISEFYAYKALFVAKFEAIREEWLKKPEFAQWTHLIRARLDSMEYIDKQLQAGYEAFVIGSTADLPRPADPSQPSLDAGLHRAANGIGDQILEEIAQIASTTFRTSLHDENGNKKSEVTQRILSPIKRIKDKLDVLSFSDPRLSQVSRYIDAVLCTLPKTGKMQSTELMAIYNLVYMLSDPDAIMRTLSNASVSATMTADDAQQVLEMVAPAVKPADVDSTPVEDDFDAVSSTTEAPSAAVAPAAVAAIEEQQEEFVYDDL